MSHFTKCQVKFNNINRLVKALMNCGVHKSLITQSEEGMVMKDYYKKGHPNKVHVKVDKKALSSYTDFGFEKRADGSMELHYDSMTKSKVDKLMREVTVDYTKQTVLETSNTLGLTLQEQWTTPKGELKMKLIGW